jgi:hypothetical protein
MGAPRRPAIRRSPFHGPRFPVTTIRDNVEAVHERQTRELGVRHLEAVIGFSMGAQQVQCAVSYPENIHRVVATSGTAKTYGRGIVRLESEITALTTDGAFPFHRSGGIQSLRECGRPNISQPRYYDSYWKSGGFGLDALAIIVETL